MSNELIIKIEESENGFICIAENGDKPFEGREHKTITDAVENLTAAYKGDLWNLKKINETTFKIDID